MLLLSIMSFCYHYCKMPDLFSKKVVNLRPAMKAFKRCYSAQPCPLNCRQTWNARIERFPECPLLIHAFHQQGSEHLLSTLLNISFGWWRGPVLRQRHSCPPGDSLSNAGGRKPNNDCGIRKTTGWRLASNTGLLLAWKQDLRLGPQNSCPGRVILFLWSHIEP